MNGSAGALGGDLGARNDDSHVRETASVSDNLDSVPEFSSVSDIVGGVSEGENHSAAGQRNDTRVRESDVTGSVDTVGEPGFVDSVRKLSSFSDTVGVGSEEETVRAAGRTGYRGVPEPGGVLGSVGAVRDSDLQHTAQESDPVDVVSVSESVSEPEDGRCEGESYIATGRAVDIKSSGVLGSADTVLDFDSPNTAQESDPVDALRVSESVLEPKESGSERETYSATDRGDFREVPESSGVLRSVDSVRDRDPLDPAQESDSVDTVQVSGSSSVTKSVDTVPESISLTDSTDTAPALCTVDTEQALGAGDTVESRSVSDYIPGELEARGRSLSGVGQIPLVVITRDDDVYGSDDRSVGRRQVRYDSVGSGTSTELYATAYGASTDYESSLEDPDLYTAFDWTAAASSGSDPDLAAPAVVDLEPSSDEEISPSLDKDKEDAPSSDEHEIRETPNKNDDDPSDQRPGTPTNIESSAHKELKPSVDKEYHALSTCNKDEVVSLSEVITHSQPNSRNSAIVHVEYPTQSNSETVDQSRILTDHRTVITFVENADSTNNNNCSFDNTGQSEIAHELTIVELHENYGQSRGVTENNDLIDGPESTTVNLNCEQNSSERGCDTGNLAHNRTSTRIDIPADVSEAGGLPNGILPGICFLKRSESVFPPTDVSHERAADSGDTSEKVVYVGSVLDGDNWGIGEIGDLERADDERGAGRVIVKGEDVVASNNIKDKLTMRRRREDGGGDQDEAEVQLMADEERRGSDVGSHYEIRGDEWNIALLFILYLLQGIPLGLCATIPMIIQNKGVTFAKQAEFSFTMWPFSLKLLWAPLVDSLYFPSFGRRKTWLVPAQYLIGFFMIFLSFHIDTWLSADDPQVGFLTLLFFTMNFLAATQDIAVDGWALTMLKRQNKSLASTCNSVGQTAGYFLGFVVFMALESPSFCNSYLRYEPLDEGMITLPGFLYFWGSVYLLVTTLVAFIKRENLDVGGDAPSVRAAFGSYHLLLRILKLKNIQWFAIILLTGKIGFAAFDGVTSLKFIEKGVPKEKLAILAVPIVPLQIILPIIITKLNHPRRPMDLYLKAFPYRLAFNLVGALFVFITPMIVKANTDIPFYYYFLLTGILAVHQMTTSAMFVQQMAFFAMVSDTDAGGTYMTLLNTLANLGGTWTSTTALAVVDTFTYRSCTGGNLTNINDCSAPALRTACSAAGGTCVTDVDGYYVEIVLLTVFGMIWFWFSRKKIDHLQNRPLSTWVVPRR